MNVAGIANFGLQAVNPLAAPVAVDNPAMGSTGFSPAGMGRMNQLVQFLQDFSSAEVVMAMLMAQKQSPLSEHAAHTHASSVATATWGLAQATQMVGIGAAGAAFAAMPAAAAGVQISVQA